jgi:GxxExxY protein
VIHCYLKNAPNVEGIHSFICVNKQLFEMKSKSRNKSRTENTIENTIEKTKATVLKKITSKKANLHTEIVVKSTLNSKTANTIDKIVDLCADVKKQLGAGHTEYAYQQALIVALGECQMHCRSEVLCPVVYNHVCVAVGRADIVVDNVIIELKTIVSVTKNVIEQICKYIEALNTMHDNRKLFCGVIVNFGGHKKTVEVYTVTNGCLVNGVIRYRGVTCTLYNQFCK